jgi:hypothetical protein
MAAQITADSDSVTTNILAIVVEMRQLRRRLLEERLCPRCEGASRVDGLKGTYTRICRSCGHSWCPTEKRP